MGRELEQVIRSRQRRGWFAIEKPATEAIRLHFVTKPNGLRLNTALAVYMTYCELANDARGEDVRIARKVIATMAGVNPKAVSEYTQELEHAGVIHIERRQVEGVNLPNIVTLVDVELEPFGGEGPTPPPVAATPDGEGLSDRGSGPEAPLSEETTPSESKEGKERAGARSPLSRSMTYKSKKVPADVVIAAADALAVFNAATDRDLSATDTAGGPSPALKQIVGAMLSRPEVPPEKWQEAVRRTVEAPPDWVDGTVQIGHVFGERAAEWALAERTATPARGGQKVSDEVARGDELIAAALNGRNG